MALHEGVGDIAGIGDDKYLRALLDMKRMKLAEAVNRALYCQDTNNGIGSKTEKTELKVYLCESTVYLFVER